MSPFAALYPLLAILAIALGCISGCSTTSRIQPPSVPQTSVPAPVQAGAVVPGDYSYTQAYLSWLIQDKLANDGLVGLSIALVDESGIVWSRGFGYADAERGIPADTDTIYRAGSLAKLLTATAVLQLEERGAIDIDQAIDAALPTFAIKTRFPNADPITPRDLLTHHAGLPSDLSKGMWSNDDFSRIDALLREEYAAYPPGLVFAYSNLGYDVLGKLVESVQPRPFEDYIQDEIFTPLGMHSSSYHLDEAAKQRLAKGYKGGRARALLPMRDLPAAGLYTNVADLSRFVRMLLRNGSIDGESILAPTSVAESFLAQNRDVDLDFDFRIGLPWFLDPGSIRNTGPVARHGGTTMYYNSQVIVLPEQKFGVIVLSNTHGTRRLVAQVAETAIKLGLEAKAGIHQPEPAPTFAEAGGVAAATVSTPMRPAADERAEAVRKTAGLYATKMGLVDISPVQGKLCTCNVGKVLNIIPQPDGSFGVEAPSADTSERVKRKLEAMKFSLRKVDGHEVLALRRGGRMRLFGEKITPKPIPVSWRRHLGDYRVVNADPQFPVDQVSLSSKKGLLYFNYRLPRLSATPISIPISAVSDSEAITMGLGRTRGETVRIAMVDGEERLLYSGYQAERACNCSR